MSDYIKWQSDFSTGIPIIDEQHKALIKIINKLYRSLLLLKPSEDQDKILDIFQELYEYSNYHFKTEESLMEKYGHPNILQHKMAHQKFVKKLDEFFLNLKEKEIKDVSLALLKFLKQWFNSHVLKMDKEIKFNLNLQPKETSLDFYKIHGLLSREELLRVFRELLYENKKKVFSIMVFDIDDFYLINRKYGFDIADFLLEDFAKHLRKSFKKDEFLIAKFEGDKFALILEDDKNLLKTFKIIEKLFKEVESYKFKIVYNERYEFIKFTISLGLAIYPRDGTEPEDLLLKAEAALKIAKDKGKNRWELFNEKEYLRLEKILKYKDLLEEVIEKRLVFPFVQPIFSSKSLKPIGGELLLRIYSEQDQKFISASEFIEEALKLNYLDSLEKIMFENFKNSPLVSSFRGYFIFINRTINSFEKFERLIYELEDWISIVEKFGISLVIEITEKSLIEFVNLLPLVSKKIKEKSIFLAVDDFGSGYASFSYLLRFKPDYIKIDGEFVKSGISSKDGRKVLKGIIKLAKDLRIKTIAEYVENEEIMNFLIKANVDFLQGYHLGKPMSLEEFASQLQK